MLTFFLIINITTCPLPLWACNILADIMEINPILVSPAVVFLLNCKLPSQLFKRQMFIHSLNN